jgi:cyclopropane-fatty-acyl-phospholipid synthase
MNETIVPAEKRTALRVRPGLLDRMAKRALFSLLRHLSVGQVHLLDGDRRHTFGRRGRESTLRATVKVHHPAFYRQIFFGGSIGAGEAYMDGHWSADDLTAIIRMVLRNRTVFEQVDRGWARITTPANKLFHALRRDTLKGSRRNIAAHYDLGNAFYSLFLDETLTYSCGIFEREESTLQEASLAKYDRICKKLRLKASDHLLEIGTGWGGFALFAAARYGCRITTITLSRAQHELANRRIREAGLADRVEVLLRDYRDLSGTFDKLVSIEMIEAVGHHYLDSFFRTCSDRLKEDGLMVLQAITITDRVFEAHKSSVDFIKRYIFPGSCIPSITAMCAAVARGTDMKLDHLEDITPHYVRTLRAWRSRFLGRLDRVRGLGFPDTFIRMWEFYLCYCEAGFQERYLGDVQMRFIKPSARPEPILPALT